MRKTKPTGLRSTMKRKSMQKYKGDAPKATRKKANVALSESGQSKKFKDKEVAKSKAKPGYRQRMDAAEL